MKWIVMIMLLCLAAPASSEEAELREDGAKAVAAAEEADTDLDTLMAGLEERMAEIRSVQASFFQQKELSLLASTVVIKGRMALEGDRLAWHVDEPVRYSVVVIDAVMRQWDEDTGRVQRQSLKGNPVFQAVMEQLGHWFAGRYRPLRQEYRVELLERSPALRLRFVPREESPAAKAIRSVTVEFPAEDAYIRGLKIVDAAGDATTLTFSDAVLNAPVPEETWRVGERE